ncbi:hypothetical protein C8R48DRAFT_676501 [Suillus tomentosus]|nr:hypothetical protein C8R48DRAFT_676501 [Suillus tomentosus]
MKYESRKFIDLIQGITYKWTNWDPERTIEVGDYGMVNKSTGEFEREGNIYTSKGIINIDMTDPALHPEEKEGDNKLIVKSWDVTIKETDMAPEAKQAAAMVVYKPRYISLPKDECIIELFKSRPDDLKGKYIITKVICCPAYVMYMSTNRAEKFSVTLPATEPPASTGFTCSSETTYGLYHEGSNMTTKYMPLYRLKKPRDKFWLNLSQHGDKKIDDSIKK